MLGVSAAKDRGAGAAIADDPSTGKPLEHQPPVPPVAWGLQGCTFTVVFFLFHLCVRGSTCEVDVKMPQADALQAPLGSQGNTQPLYNCCGTLSQWRINGIGVVQSF